MEDLKLLEQNKILQLNREYYSLLIKAQRKFRYNLTGAELRSCRLVGILKAVRSYQEELGCLSSWLYQQVYYETLTYVRGINKELPGLNRVDLSLERIPSNFHNFKLIDAKLDEPLKFTILFDYHVAGLSLKQISACHTISLFKLNRLISD